MKNYTFKLMISSNVVGEGYGAGHSAIEAFENGVDNVTVLLPHDQEVEVVAVSDRGVGVKFKASRSF